MGIAGHRRMSRAERRPWSPPTADFFPNVTSGAFLDARDGKFFKALSPPCTCLCVSVWCVCVCVWVSGVWPALGLHDGKNALAEGMSKLWLHHWISWDR